MDFEYGLSRLSWTGWSIEHRKDHLLYMPEKQSDKRDDKFEEGQRQTAAEELAAKHCKYALDCILLHVCKGNDIRYVERWSGNTPVAHAVKPSESTPKHFVTWYWRRMSKNDVVRQRFGRAHVNESGKVPRSPTLARWQQCRGKIWNICQWFVKKWYCN